MNRAKNAESKQKATEKQIDQGQGSVQTDSERIRQAAYYKWEAAGCPNGDGIEFWLAAEAEQSTTNRPNKPK